MGTRPSLRAPGPGVAQGKNQANGRRLAMGPLTQGKLTNADSPRLWEARGLRKLVNRVGALSE